MWCAWGRRVGGAAALWLVSAASASAGDAPPAVDLGAVPATARLRPQNQNDRPHQAMVSLLTADTTLVAGQTQRVGVLLEPDEGWHTYWRSPGEVGAPLKVTWSLPDGFEMSAPLFPVPERYDSAGIISFGFDGPMLLQFDLSVPSDASPGEVTLAGAATWLVCHESCVQGAADLALPITVGEDDGPSAAAPLFAFFDSQLPAPDPAVGVEVALSQGAFHPGDPLRVALRVAPTGDEAVTVPTDVGSWPAFTPIFEPESTWIDQVTVTPQDDGSTLIVMTGETYEMDSVPAYTAIGGLLQAKVGDRWVRTEVERNLPWAPAETPVTASSSPLWDLVSSADDTPAGGAAPEAMPAAAPAALVAGGAAPIGGAGLLQMLAMAFVGGLILNIMPCVLPVITLKLFRLVEHSDGTVRQQRMSGVAYAGGVIASFLVLAGAVLAMKWTAGSVGWGFQFQSPLYVAALTTIVFVFGLSLFGVFEIPVLGANAASSASDRGGVVGDFFSGVFATLLSTPCSAPFLGTAIGFAFAQSAPVVVAFFVVIGAGLAAPVLLVSFVPALFKVMPRPGAWMETFKHLMGFTLMGTAIWLVHVLGTQVGMDHAIGFLGFLGFVAGGAWVFGRWGGVEQTGLVQLRALGFAGVVALAGGVWLIDLGYVEDASACDDGALAAQASFDDEIPWQRFSEERLAAASGTPVFIDFTADWCLTCKVNEKTIIDTAPVREAMAACGMVALRADWTRRDEVITEWLTRFGKAGVPFYLVVPADGEDAIALPEVLTASMVVSGIQTACG